MRTLLLTMLVLTVTPLVATACGPVGPNSGVVGGDCRDDIDCARGSFCLDGGRYPDGMCTVRCSDIGDCPGGADCIDRSGGVCLPVCRSHRDCRGGYECDEQDIEGDPGEALVCIGD